MLYSIDSVFVSSSAVELSSALEVKSRAKGVEWRLVLLAQPAVSKYLFRMDMQYLVWSIVWCMLINTSVLVPLVLVQIWMGVLLQNVSLCYHFFQSIVGHLHNPIKQFLRTCMRNHSYCHQDICSIKTKLQERNTSYRNNTPHYKIIDLYPLFNF